MATTAVTRTLGSRKRGGIGWLGWLALLATTAIALFPMYWLLVNALTSIRATPPLTPILIPAFSLDNFRRLLGGNPFYKNWMLNSLIVAIGVTAWHIFFDTMAGYAFAKRRFPGRNLLFWVILSTLMIPIHVTIIPLYVVTRKLGLLDNLLAVILPGTATAFGIFLMRQYIQTLPSELEDAARIAFYDLTTWLSTDYGFERMAAYQLCSQVARVRVANMVDTLYSIVAKFPKRYLPAA